MIKRACKRCGEIFDAATLDTAYCPECHTIVKRELVMRERICRQCGAGFMGGPRAWYCPTCRLERRRATDKKFKKAGTQRAIGSIDQCTVCGGDYVVNSARQKYCPACSADATKQSVRPHKRAYNAEHRDELTAHQRNLRTDRNVCVICGKVFDTHTPIDTCSTECRERQRYLNQAKSDYKRGKRKTPPK